VQCTTLEPQLYTSVFFFQLSSGLEEYIFLGRNANIYLYGPVFFATKM